MSDLMLKCIKFDFRWGSAIDPAGGAYSAPPAVFKGAYFQWCIGGGYTRVYAVYQPPGFF